MSKPITTFTAHHERYKTMEECVKYGGHCFESDGRGVMLSNPPQYGEVCKHCPASRIGRPQAGMAYSEPRPI